MPSKPITTLKLMCSIEFLPKFAWVRKPHSSKKTLVQKFLITEPSGDQHERWDPVVSFDGCATQDCYNETEEGSNFCSDCLEKKE